MASSLTNGSIIVNGTQEITGISNTLNDSANEIVTSGGLMDFLYEHGILKKKYVGGTVFYIDSTADGTYTFKNAQGQTVAAPTVGTDCTGWTYEVTGATKDKYYVYYPTPVTSKYWGYNEITTSATGTGIGAGKTNTSTVLAITDTSSYASGSIWKYIKDMRTNKTNGCDDWFVGCDAELEQLRLSGTTGAGWFYSYYIWSSREYNSAKAYSSVVYDSDWIGRNKDNQDTLVPLRAF